MSTKTNAWKLGLFVVAGVAVVFGALVWLGASQFERVEIPMVTYFDESVEGLDVGSEVKFRGVAIGSVPEIRIAPDQSQVEVHVAVYQDVLHNLGFKNDDELLENWGTPGVMPQDIRFQIAAAGITGRKFLSAERVDPAQYPPPDLPFDVPWNYVPSRPSTLKSLEVGVTEILVTLPGVLAELKLAVTQTNRRIEELDIAGLSARAEALLETSEQTLKQGGETLTELSAVLKSWDAPESPLRLLAAQAEQTLQGFDATLAAADLPGTTAAIRDAGVASTLLARDLDDMTDEIYRNLISFREAMRAIDELASLLEREPVAPFSGKAPTTGP